MSKTMYVVVAIDNNDVAIMKQFYNSVKSIKNYKMVYCDGEDKFMLDAINKYGIKFVPGSSEIINFVFKEDSDLEIKMLSGQMYDSGYTFVVIPSLNKFAIIRDFQLAIMTPSELIIETIERGNNIY